MCLSGDLRSLQQRGVLTSNNAFLIMECTPVRRTILNSMLCVAGNIVSNPKKSGSNPVVYTIASAPPKRVIPQLITAPTLSLTVVGMLAGERRLAIQTITSVDRTCNP